MKIDFKKEYREFYDPPAGQVEDMEIPAFKFLMLDGRGRPGGEAFQTAVGTLYGIAYCIKMDRKKHQIDPDYTLGPLEALWWMEGELDMMDRDEWFWTLMLWQPDFITKADVVHGAELLAKKRPDLKSDDVVFQTFKEGRVIQYLHFGPYNTEDADIELLHDYAQKHGLTPNGHHHEIYLSDPRRTEPQKLRTILRQPVTGS